MAHPTLMTVCHIRCSFRAQYDIYKYIYIYIKPSVQVRKKHILCALYFGETIKLVIFCMMKTLMRKNKTYRWKNYGV